MRGVGGVEVSSTFREVCIRIHAYKSPPTTNDTAALSTDSFPHSSVLTAGREKTKHEIKVTRRTRLQREVGGAVKTGRVRVSHTPQQQQMGALVERCATEPLAGAPA